MKRVAPHLTAFARRLRREATAEERTLWRLLSRCRPAFTRQHVIGPYIADFACRGAKLIVELDGSQHLASSRDRARTGALEAQGWLVLRFWNSEVRQNAGGVVEAILAAVAARTGEAPRFAASRAGRARKPRYR
ncbi:MAG: endonuclease domain-containing protein [Sphingomonadaceae bacterium]